MSENLESKIGLLYRDEGTCWNKFIPRCFFAEELEKPLTEIPDFGVNVQYKVTHMGLTQEGMYLVNCQGCSSDKMDDLLRYLRPIQWTHGEKTYLGRVMGHGDKKAFSADGCCNGRNAHFEHFPVKVAYREVET